jgi:hypothetical protein
MAKVTGVKFVRINGEKVKAKDDSVNLKFGGSTKTPAMANGIVIGASSKGTASELEFTLVHTFDVDEEALNALEEGVVIVETDTGRAYLMKGATISDPVELNGGEGEMPIKIFGQEVETL